MVFENESLPHKNEEGIGNNFFKGCGMHGWEITLVLSLSILFVLIRHIEISQIMGTRVVFLVPLESLE
jgi:hypothetical protein